MMHNSKLSSITQSTSAQLTRKDSSGELAGKLVLIGFGQRIKALAQIAQKPSHAFASAAVHLVI